LLRPFFVGSSWLGNWICPTLKKLVVEIPGTGLDDNSTTNKKVGTICDTEFVAYVSGHTHAKP